MSDPPPAFREDKPRGLRGGDLGDPEERPMSLPLAAVWALSITFLFVWFLAVLVAIRPSAQSDLVSTFGCQAVAYLLGLFGILRLHAPHASIRDFLGIRPTHLAFFPLAVLLGLALEAPIGALYDLIARRWPTPREGELELLNTLASGTAIEQATLGLVLVVLGPALEEVLFRGALTRPLLRRYGAPVVIVATAALFAIAHFQPQKFLPIGLFGLALGMVRYASGSILPAMLMHATYNAVPFVALLGASADVGAAEAVPTDAPRPFDLRQLLIDPASLPPAAVAGSTVLAALLLAAVFALAARSKTATQARHRDHA
ncbi:CPBP family intramembrane glutamic endopeptidase [Chondromyces crocatus]|uniref:CAAX prenyl protease 2/Lysostaphin resistance protein A-like domain-containing protein n=1 Tax=Chondromyces crocatus TaxID=52 RepID=A0A0K1EB55_CHOCO|nr:type II CAAX endopeptidase family protein [Chondromyces crocatus]AKT38074.1 uncharacterized protein CMC5_022160 [Chondromyces crocatus]